MQELLDMHGRMTSKFHDKLKKICDPLITCFGVSQFYHCTLSHSGRLVNLGLHPDWEETLFSDDKSLNWPTFRNLYHFEPIVVMSTIFDKEKKSSVINVAKDKFKVNHSLELINKTAEGIEFFGFALKSSSSQQHLAFYKELPMLKLFVKRYKEEFCSDFHVFKNYEIDISRFLSTSSYKTSETERDNKRNLFLKKLKIEIPILLSRREIEIARNLIKGWSATEIGHELFISPRTVEHHLERIKDKLNCSTKSELINKVLEFEILGYL